MVAGITCQAPMYVKLAPGLLKLPFFVRVGTIVTHGASGGAQSPVPFLGQCSFPRANLHLR